jgi:hypothetical protein
MTTSRDLHERCVDAWLEQHGEVLFDVARASALLGDALAAICVRSETSLGRATVSAIVERVSVESGGKGAPADVARFVLVETLCALSTLSGGALTEALHDELVVTTRVPRAASSHRRRRS